MRDSTAIVLPPHLAAACGEVPERRAWLERLPALIEEIRRRWSLVLSAPFEGDEVSCAWVAPAVCADGTAAVLKLAMPHFEGEHEIQGLRFWDGDPTVRLLEADEEAGTMLLERCEPGTHLRELPEPEQDRVIVGLLRRLWRQPPASYPFRPLSALMAHWSAETLSQAASWLDEGLVREGLQLFEELPQSAPSEVLLATDLHGGNVLAAQREPWLVIDPKPFVGDPAYDATQHLLNCHGRLLRDSESTIRRFADLLEIDAERIRLWIFARAAAEPRDLWNDDAIELARLLHQRVLPPSAARVPP